VFACKHKITNFNKFPENISYIQKLKFATF